MKKFAIYNMLAAGALLAVGLLGPGLSYAQGIPCTSQADAGQMCGFSDGWFTTTAQCVMTGAQDVNDPSLGPIVVLGGQVCGAIGASDQAGWYKDGSGPHLYPGSRPFGWNYSVTAPYNALLPSAIPSGEFVVPSDPYSIMRFFPGNIVDIAFSPGDDAASLTIGQHTVGYTTGCLGNWSSQTGPPCNTEVGSYYFGANPGDPISFTVINAYAPNGSGNVAPWANDQVQVAFTVTVCSTANYLQQQGFTDVVDYHPTNVNQCTPSVPVLSAVWQAGGSNQTITLSPGQTSVNIPFTYTDNGQAHSKIININPQCPAQITAGTLPVTAAANPNCITPTVQN